MLKSILHIAVSLLLLVATAGFSISKHYCGENLISVVPGTQAESCCDGPCNCCHDETLHFQVEDDYVSGEKLQMQIKVLTAPYFQLTGLLECEAGFIMQFTTNTEYTSLKLPVPSTVQSRISALQTFLL